MRRRTIVALRVSEARVPVLDQLGNFRPFPDADTVFRDDVETHRRVLHPVLSVDVRMGSPRWSGTLHFVLPVEPWDGALGEGRTQFHGPNCGYNWIKFSVTGSKYLFGGDFRYFKITSDPADETTRTYDEFEKSYCERKAEFLTTGAIGPRKGVWINQMSGAAPGGNWANSFRTEEAAHRHGELPGRVRLVRDGGNVGLVNANGSPFHYIGGLVGYHYRDFGADSLHLFFDPAASEALIALDFT
jgi:hypothetical protein